MSRLHAAVERAIRSAGDTGATVPEVVATLRNVGADLPPGDYEAHLVVGTARKATAATATLDGSEVVKRDGWTVWSLQ